ncbi:hypothetical protein ACA910_002515 [Epithemia clementina (nom. ined.)]
MISGNNAAPPPPLLEAPEQAPLPPTYTITTTSTVATTTREGGSSSSSTTSSRKTRKQQQQQQQLSSKQPSKQQPQRRTSLYTIDLTTGTEQSMSRHSDNNDNHEYDDDDDDDDAIDDDRMERGQRHRNGRSGCRDGVVVIKTTEQKLLEAERIIATEIYNLNTVPEDLSTWSAAAAFFQITQALILMFLAIDDGGNWYWFVSYPNPSLEDSSNSTLYDFDYYARTPELKQVAAFSVLWLVPLVPLLSGIEHLSCIAFREMYDYYIERHQNPFRWTEYTFSASLMKVIIAQQVGITDVHLLAAMFVLMVISIQCAATHEAINAKARSEHRRQYWRPFFTGWIGHLANWALIANYFCVYTSRGGDPRTVWALLATQFILDTSFAILFTLQWKKIGIFEDYVAGEKGFIFLSFTAKTLLIWLTALNALN